MGRVAIVPQGVQEGIINQALLKITPNYEMVTSLYLKLLIESEGIQRKYFRNAAGSAIQNVASVGTLKKIIAPLPPLPLQQEFAKLVEEIEAEKARQAESKKKLDELFNSLLQRAFKGELVG
jgi:type I restriction enzyme S subunit